MELSLNDLLCQPSGKVKQEEILQKWSWLSTDLPVLFTAVGDVFVQAEDAKVYFLDTAKGEIEEVAENGAAFQECLTQEEFVAAKFHPDTVALYRRSGKKLNAGKVYSYEQALILGGDDQVHNLKITSLEDHLDSLGELHLKVKDLPEDARVELED